MAGGGRSRRLLLWGTIVGLCLAVPAVALGAFPGTPGESPRLNTPNDPKFDRCEADDPEPPAEPTADDPCSSYAEEEFRFFGFSPDSAIISPGVHTPYVDCAQLDADGQAANVAAGDPPCSQIAGIRADSAWKYSTGDPDTVIAILDTGIFWQERELVDKIHLNRDELPPPQKLGPPREAGSPACGGLGASGYDINASGEPGFNVHDYVCDPRVSITAGDSESDDILDASDLIATFSSGSYGSFTGGVDDGGNGFVDDIAGWDFFDDDNDPFDASSCCNAGGHGTDRAQDAAAETDNQLGSPGVCPHCQVMPLRVWDTFVVPGDNYAMGVVYATQNGAAVVEGAVGGLTNTRFARSAFTYADDHGVALTLVSSDINSANHNYPTNYNEAIYVSGSLYDTAPNNTCSGPGGIPGIGDFPGGGPPPQFTDGCNELLDRLGGFPGCGVLPALGVPPTPCISPSPTLQPTTTSFFRNANLTQYGGKADIVLMGPTGSQNTSQASGAAGLLASYGRQELATPLSGNEIRQLLTMTAEDVRPLNTGTIGPADKADIGWDTHFGYGRVNLAAAMARIANDHVGGDPPCALAAPNCVPPEAQIDSPDWFAPVDVDRLSASGLAVTGHVAAPHKVAGDGIDSWELEYACGQDALDVADPTQPTRDAFDNHPALATGTGPVDGALATIPKALLTQLASTDPLDPGFCDGSVANDPGRPAGTSADAWPADPYPAPDPERHAVQLRLTVHAQGDVTNIGRYRKTIFPYADDGNLPAWPRPLGTGSDASKLVSGSGGEVSPRLYDVDGDNELDVIQANSSGEIAVLHANGTPVASFNGGQPVSTDRYLLEENHPVPPGVVTPHESPRVPAIGDIDGDRQAEIVVTAGEHVYVWGLDGTRELKVRLDPSLSDPCKPGVPKPCFGAGQRAITSQNHIKRGFFGSPSLADLDGDGALEIVTTALDQHLYAFSGSDGSFMPGFPVKLESDGADGAEIITSPAIANLDGNPDNGPEIIAATNEVIPGNPAFPTSLFELTSALLGSTTGSNPVYAVHANGGVVDGWPVTVGVAAGDLLPLVLPGHDAAVVDADDDGDDEVSVSAATSLMPGGARLVDGDGSSIASYTNPDPNPEVTDQGPVLNLADYQSIGDVLGAGLPAVFKGGLTLNGAVNLLAVNQNLPFSHVEQAWDPQTGVALPGFPRATDDFQLLSQASIARVAGSGPGRQALVGTGLYNLHAYGTGGAEPAGWPKFTGGWIQSTPAIGDADGDGNLDVTALTREGWSFLWSTDVDACDDSNEEWWTYHHDEHSTANYGSDGRPPGTVRDLAVAANADGSADLTWTAPGDDWLCGGADRFQVLLANGPIDSPGDGAVVTDAAAAAASGDAESVPLTAAQLAGNTRAAVLYRDEAGNWGLLKSIALPTPANPPGGGGGGGGGYGEGCANHIDGTKGKDSLKGTSGSDRIRGLGGDDTLKGRGGDDCASGQGGEDRVGGGPGADDLKGGRGKDRLKGGAGNDVIRARRGGRDRINCGPGKDVAIVSRKFDRISKNCEKVRGG